MKKIDKIQSSRKAYKLAIEHCLNVSRAMLAFNVQNQFQAEALKQVSDKLNLPVIAQMSAKFVQHTDLREGLDSFIERFQSEKIFFHLDHCQDLNLIQRCIEVGFAGVMFDGSASDLNQNISTTIAVVKMAHAANCLVEGEVGEIGGVEDGLGSEEMSYASVQEALKFSSQTNVDLFAIGFGNAHGFYQTTTSLNPEILGDFQKSNENRQALVLHGGTGMPDSIIEKCVQYGVVKINVSTQLKSDTIAAIRKYIDNNELYNEIDFERNVIDNVKHTMNQMVQKWTA